MTTTVAGDTTRSKTIMGMQEHEVPMDYLRRVLSKLNGENEFVLDQLPSVHSIFEYHELLESYNADGLVDIGAAIESGDEDSTRYDNFCLKYDLRWRRHYPMAEV
jgi:hypothetical protein